MYALWPDVILPLVDAAGGARLLEIGSEFGETTRALADWARPNGAEVHSIDPKPRFDVDALAAEYGSTFVFHQGLSLDVLPEIGAFDVALVDGDHNWYTVRNELGLLASAAATAGLPLPLIVAHDAGWPYARRDMYYDPETVPPEGRQEMAKQAILPGRVELGETGMNAELWNAVREGGPRNGVLTAVEDFASQLEGGHELVVVGGWHGVAVLASAERLARTPALQAELDRLRSPEFLSAQLARIERARIESEISKVSLERDRAEAIDRAERAKQELAEHEIEDDDSAQ